MRVLVTSSCASRRPTASWYGMAACGLVTWIRWFWFLISISVTWTLFRALARVILTGPGDHLGGENGDQVALFVKAVATFTGL